MLISSLAACEQSSQQAQIEEPGDEYYGLPYPGIFVLNPEHEIVGKIFVERYQIRVDGEFALAYALEVLDAQ